MLLKETGKPGETGDRPRFFSKYYRVAVKPWSAPVFSVYWFYDSIIYEVKTIRFMNCHDIPKVRCSVEKLRLPLPILIGMVIDNVKEEPGFATASNSQFLLGGDNESKFCIHFRLKPT